MEDFMAKIEISFGMPAFFSKPAPTKKPGMLSRIGTAFREELPAAVARAAAAEAAGVIVAVGLTLACTAFSKATAEAKKEKQG
jgi:hypothetical protein